MSNIKHVIVEQVLDMLFPPSERELFVRALTVEHMPVVPQTSKAGGANITSLMPYDNDAVRACVRALKFNRSKYAAKLCADILTDFLLEEISDMHIFGGRNIALVPMPLGKARVRERGYNQIELVLNACSKTLSESMPTARVEKRLLVRTRETKPQMSLPREARLKNVRDAFAVTAHAHTYKQKPHVFLIDDITTTGATLKHAARPLRRAGFGVTLLALARA